MYMYIRQKWIIILRTRNNIRKNVRFTELLEYARSCNTVNTEFYVFSSCDLEVSIAKLVSCHKLRTRNSPRSASWSCAIRDRAPSSDDRTRCQCLWRFCRRIHTHTSLLRSAAYLWIQSGGHARSARSVGPCCHSSGGRSDTWLRQL